MKEEYKHIVRIYARAEYPDIDEKYKEYLLKYYEDTYFPESALNAGKAVYIKRNFDMIDKSDFCIVYYKEGRKYKSGTEIAYKYACKKHRVIFNSAISVI